MKKRLAIILLLLIAAPLSAGTIATAKRSSGAHYLVDAKGMTLYVLMRDSAGKSTCTGGCLDRWPPFSPEAVSVESGLVPEEFAVMTREDGKSQLTFRGMPLYYYVGDKAPGEMNGQGLNSVWFIVDPQTFKP